MGKTRDLFKETRDIRGTFHVRMGVAQRLKGLPLMLETWVRSLGREDPLEKEMATHSRILAWRIPWTEEPGGLQSTGSQRVRHNLVTDQPINNIKCTSVIFLIFINTL